MSDLWKTTSIGQCLVTSFAGEWGSDPTPGNAVVYRATDIDDEGRIVGGGAARHLPIGKLKSKALQTGDILLEGSGGGPGKPVGRVAYFDEEIHGGPATCSNFFRTLRPSRDHVDPRFLLQKLFWFYKQPPILALQQQTTGIINLKFSEYLASRIELPELVSEQAKIAEILDVLDTAIRATEALIAKLKAVKQGLLHDLLTRGIDANGELRPSRSEAPHLYKASPLGWIPEEWCFDSISNLTVSSVIGPFGSDLVSADYRMAGVPIVFVRDIKPDRVIWKSGVFIDAKKALELSAHEVVSGDVVATKMGFPPCVAAVYPESMPNGVVTADIVRLRPDCSRIFAEWMSIAINSNAVVNQVEKITAGVTRPKVTLRDVRDLCLVVPPLEEQQKLLDRIDAFGRRVLLEDAKLRKLSAEKSGLMDDLLTGRVRVTPLLDAATA